MRSIRAALIELELAGRIEYSGGDRVALISRRGTDRARGLRLAQTSTVIAISALAWIDVKTAGRRPGRVNEQCASGLDERRRVDERF